MGARFSTASSQGLILSSPQTLTRPFCVGFWYKTSATGVRRHLTGWDNGSVGWAIAVGAANTTVVFQYWDGATQQFSTNISSVPSADWNFVLARDINNSNRRMSIVSNNGIRHGSSASTISTSQTQITIGATLGVNYMEGSIAEWWFLSGDVQADGAQADDALVRQLAYLGPFSVPHIAPNVVEYRSFRSGVLSNADQGGEVYQRGGPRQWEAFVNEPGVGEHPPVPAYVRPNQNRRILAV